MTQEALIHRLTEILSLVEIKAQEAESTEDLLKTWNAARAVECLIQDVEKEGITPLEKTISSVGR